MLCDWTEKVSLLVDGELPRAEAASVESHLAGCAECRAARGEFLFFREQLGAYHGGVNAAAQRRALEAVLGSRRAGATATRRGPAAALGLSPLRPEAAFALALVALVAVGLGVYVNRRRDAPQVVHTPAIVPDKTRMTASASPTPSPSADVSNNSAGERKTVAGVKDSRRRGGGRSVTASVARAGRPPVEAARPATANGGVLDGGVVETAAAAAEPASRREWPRAGLDTSRHVEQAQLLLRSFRNARAGDDLAYERERSERLLYRNIVLRREAAKQNDPVLASVLGRLEPILLDIANLPARPADEDVAPIRERVRRQNLVVALQAGIEKQ